MQVSLPSELQELVKANVASGAYASEEEVIVAALHLLKEQTSYFKEEINRGIEEADRKQFSTLSLEDLKAEGRRRLANERH